MKSTNIQNNDSAVKPGYEHRSYGSYVELKHIYCWEAETLILGHLLQTQHQEDIAKVHDILRIQDFYCQEHQIIFESICDLYCSKEPIDFHTVYIALKDKDNLNRAGGLPNLTRIVQYSGCSVDIDHYIKIVQNKSLCRKLLDFTENLQSLITKKHLTPLEAYDEAQNMLINLNEKTANTIKSLIFEKELFWQHYITKKEDLSRKLLTGYTDLDSVTHGIAPSRYWVIAARPSVGKTTFALNLIYNVLKQDKKVLFFSVEMNWVDIEKIMLSIESKISYDKIQEQDLDMANLAQLRKDYETLRERQLYIDDYTNDIVVLRNRARMMQSRYGLDLIVIDYLQLLHCAYRENKQNEISEISRNLRELSKELNVPIIVLSQLSRRVEERNNKIPLMSDLRDSGSIEQDADVVMLLNRPDYYKIDDRPNEIDIIVAKNRYGRCKTIPMYFNKDTMRFNLLARQTSINKIAYI